MARITHIRLAFVPIRINILASAPTLISPTEIREVPERLGQSWTRSALNSGGQVNCARLPREVIGHGIRSRRSHDGAH